MKTTMDFPGRLAMTVKRNFPISPQMQEIPKPFETPGAWFRVFPLPMHACRGLSHWTRPKGQKNYTEIKQCSYKSTSPTGVICAVSAA